MGLSGSKTTQSNTPYYATQLNDAANTVTGVYNQNAGKVQGYADSIGSLVPGLLDRYNEGNPALTAASDYITRTLGNTGGNPFLGGIIDQSNNDTARALGTNLGTRGLTGGSSLARILANEVSKNSMNLRYNDYNNQQQLQAQAAGMAPNIALGELANITPLLGAATTASGLPMQAAGQYASGIGGLLGQYTNTTQKSGGGLGGVLGGIGAVLSAAPFLGISDSRLKEDVRRVGQTDGGLTVYTYRYKGEPAVHMGVMAQEAAQVQPHALGPDIGGFHTVNYREVR